MKKLVPINCILPSFPFTCIYSSIDVLSHCVHWFFNTQYQKWNWWYFHLIIKMMDWLTTKRRKFSSNNQWSILLNEFGTYSKLIPRKLVLQKSTLLMFSVLDFLLSNFAREDLVLPLMLFNTFFRTLWVFKLRVILQGLNVLQFIFWWHHHLINSSHQSHIETIWILCHLSMETKLSIFFKLCGWLIFFLFMFFKYVIQCRWHKKNVGETLYFCTIHFLT